MLKLWDLQRGLSAVIFAIIATNAVTAALDHVQPQVPWIEKVDADSRTLALDQPASHRDQAGTIPESKVIATSASSPTDDGTCSYWLEDVKHQGVAAFNPDPQYQVFRNVKDFGAKGDGVTDDTAAINLAISSLNQLTQTPGRCGPGDGTSTIYPGVVYFPAGTYILSSSIIDFYQTQLIGNPNCLPILRAMPDFNSPGEGNGIINGNQYLPGGAPGFQHTNVFWRQVRNFIIDMTLVSPEVNVVGIHWATAQATSLQNIVFKMSDASGTQHEGVFIEDGSGGFMNDLIFYGGNYGVNFGSQQFTVRNLTFHNAVTAISQAWDWGWTYQGISIHNCTTGLDMSAVDNSGVKVGSVTFFDSDISDTPTGIKTARDATTTPVSAGNLILENVILQNVGVAVLGPGGQQLGGTTGSSPMVIEAWGEGHSYTPTGPGQLLPPVPPNMRPASLVSGSKYYQRSKPQYEDVPFDSGFLSVRTQGAVGDGVTDDTYALQNAIKTAAEQDLVLFVDAGTYKVSQTIDVYDGSRIVGESYSVIMGSGTFFSNMSQPQPVVRVGKCGDTGQVEWSDMIVSTQGGTAGAVLIEWNLASPLENPSGMWDVHTRIGGFAGSNLRLTDCPATPGVQTPPANLKTNCIAAFMSMHITDTAAGLYMENVWLWTADHEVDSSCGPLITVYTGRGLLISSTKGAIWLVGTAVEHHALYQYQLVDTTDVFMGFMQTETAYYQPNPPAPLPFAPVSELDDPDFAALCGSPPAPGCAFGWGLRVVDSANISVYGAGLYNFFSNYGQGCLRPPMCQNTMASIECAGVGGSGLCAPDASSAGVSVYNLLTSGAANMLDLNGVSMASASGNEARDPTDGVALFRCG